MTTQPVIFDAAAKCRKSFIKCQRVDLLMENEWAENRLADFNLWASGIGASVRSRASLDARLALKVDARNIVAGLLELLNSSIEECIMQAQANISRSDTMSPKRVGEDDKTDGRRGRLDARSPQHPPQRAFSPWPGDTGSESQPYEASYLTTNNILSENIRNVDKMLDQLARVAIAIRQSGTTSRLQKADKTFDIDDHKDLRSHLIAVILSRKQLHGTNWFSSEQVDPLTCGLTAIQFRLIDCNLKRRNRFLYAQRHSKALDAQSSSGDTLSEEKAPQQSKSHYDRQRKLNNPATVIPELPSGSAKPAEQDGDMLVKTDTSASRVTDQFLLPQNPVPSQTSTTRLSTVLREIDYPHPPKMNSETLFFRCPCCCQTLRANMREKQRWIKHLAEDLCPYTCILPDCSKPYTLYIKKEAWMKHLHQDHRGIEYWLCFACVNAPQFNEERSFKEHISKVHDDTISKDQIPMLVSSCKQSAPAEIDSCPLCNWSTTDGEENDRGALIQHIARDLHAFSLRSLPWNDDNEQESEWQLYQSSERVFKWLSDNRLRKSPSIERPPLDRKVYVSNYFQRNLYFADNSASINSSDHSSYNSREKEFQELKDIQGPIIFESTAVEDEPSQASQASQDSPAFLSHRKLAGEPESREFSGEALNSTTSHSRDVDNNTIGDSATIHQGDIYNVFSSTLERRETPPRPFQLVPFRRDPDFVSCGDILDQISVLCLEPAGRVALLGLGGVGKSQLAIEFAHRVAEERSDIWVFWIHASTQARVEEGFRMIADAVKLPERKQPRANIPLLVRNWLSNEPNGRWIIILDNADYSEVLYGADESGHDQLPLATYIPKSRNGSIVLTTRNRNLASKLTGGYKNIIEIGPMTDTNALALLEKKMGSPMDVHLAEDLVKALECIPLAISQAAAYIQARKPRSSIEKYLIQFRKNERGSTKLLEYEANDIRRDEEASNAVLRTWTISFEYVRSQQRSAADLLSLMSFFDRQSIPEWVIKNSPDKTENPESRAGDSSSSESETDDSSDSDIDSKFEEDTLILRNYCLIAVNEEGNKFEMHRLVQLSVKNWLKAFGLQEKFMQQYIELMAASFPSGQYENWAICEDLFAHVQVALDYRPNDDTLEDWATLCYNGGVYAHSQGRYNIAERMVLKAKKAREEKFGKDHDATLQSISLLASIISDKGRWKEAEELEMQALETRKTVLGAIHPETLASMSNLASTYRNQGRWNEAEKLQVQVLETRKTVLGAIHPESLSSMSNLALTYWKQGRWEEAEELEMQALETRKTVLGAMHPETLASMSNLASTYRNQGRWNEAEKLQVEVLETRKTVLGAMHPETLASISNLALTYVNQGRWEEAEELQVQALKTYKTVLGTDHPETLSSMSNLAHIWKAQGQRGKALALMEDCLQARQRILGLQHPDTLEALVLVDKWTYGSDDRDDRD